MARRRSRSRSTSIAASGAHNGQTTSAENMKAFASGTDQRDRPSFPSASQSVPSIACCAANTKRNRGQRNLAPLGHLADGARARKAED